MNTSDIDAMIYLIAVGSAGMLAWCAFDTWINSHSGNWRMYGKNYKRTVK